MSQNRHYDEHPLLPLNGTRPQPARISEESGTDLYPSSRVASQSPPQHGGQIHDRAEQWTRERNFDHSSSPVHANHTEYPAHNGHHPGSSNLNSGPEDLEPAQTDRSIRIAEPNNSTKLPEREDSFVVRRRRAGTFYDEAPIEKRYLQKYFFRRPRPLQVEHQGHRFEVGDDGKLDLEHPENHYMARNKSSESKSETHRPDSLKKQRERMDLFIDLLFVGIISNISENYFDQAFVDETNVGKAVGDFVLSFLPAWRIWIMLQRFLNSYYMDDIPQRILIVWVLILAMIWGNNSPYFVSQIDSENINGSTFLISTYLIAAASLRWIEILYSVWIPWLRRLFLVGFIIGIPSLALWVLATVTINANRKIWFLTAAIVYDAFEDFLLSSPAGDKLLGTNQIRKSADQRHTISRFESFFIIALGEGVFLLVRGSPLQQGLSAQLGRGVQALLIYFYLCWTYFHGEMSKQYIHALYRRWYISWLWNILHVPMYATLVLLSSGILFLVEYDPGAPITADPSPDDSSAPERRQEPTAESSPPAVYDHYRFRVATITVCVDLAVILFCQLMIGLLNRSMDSRRELLIGNQWIRMIPRALGIVALSVIWIPQYNDPTEPLGAILGIIFLVVMAEYTSGMDYECEVFEPKNAHSLTPTVSEQS